MDGNYTDTEIKQFKHPDKGSYIAIPIYNYTYLLFLVTYSYSYIAVTFSIIIYHLVRTVVAT